jgi:hypothetical protein
LRDDLDEMQVAVLNLDLAANRVADITSSQVGEGHAHAHALRRAQAIQGQLLNLIEQCDTLQYKSLERPCQRLAVTFAPEDFSRLDSFGTVLERNPSSKSVFERTTSPGGDTRGGATNSITARLVVKDPDDHDIGGGDGSNTDDEDCTAFLTATAKDKNARSYPCSLTRVRGAEYEVVVDTSAIAAEADRSGVDITVQVFAFASLLGSLNVVRRVPFGFDK